MSERASNETGKRFLEHLSRLQYELQGNQRKERKTWGRVRAVLRRSLAFEPGTYWPTFAYVEPFVEKQGWKSDSENWKREACYLVAALYALKDGAHQKGRTLAQALLEAGKSRNSKSLERRFRALLDADRDQIAFRLRQVVGLVEGELDFAQLFEDLLHWFDASRWVQVRWAREYYGAWEEKEEVEA